MSFYMCVFLYYIKSEFDISIIKRSVVFFATDLFFKILN
ncbi:hypothetical protein CLP_4210 [Clostridium butyricum E4 str. BoNT E BL5262]|uniref:Uncharacterized protein n=1 Tax=Clostridium butyricum E4 str. BoNT E BL5262 TaxID=632245 RepID=C4IME6_CLOBU|nr:hypothetical protein CLP_4210 [Clostridium butyricum E4 str. BoNT E BL5262]